VSVPSPAFAYVRNSRFTASAEEAVRKPRKQYVPILEPANPPDHFTIEEAERIVREVIEEDRRAVEARWRRMKARREAVARGAA
jgi:hypothetical protein